MASTSSLLKSAQSRRKEQADIEDKLVDFEWQSSAKTVDDFNSYVEHFQTRTVQSANDLSKSITYQTKLRSANRSFTSAEIQRSQIDVLEGTGTLQDKQAAIIDLYGLAVGNQDLDLAQNLRQQFDSINVQIQNQKTRGQGIARSMATTQSQTITEHVNKLIYGAADKDGVRDDSIVSLGFIKDTFAEYGNERFNAVAESMLPLINEEREANGQAPLSGQPGYWDVVLGIYDLVAETYQVGAEQLAGTSAGNKLAEEYNKIIGQAADGQSASFEVAEGISLDREQVIAAANAERAGQPLYSVTQENGKTTFRERTTTDYVWGVDPDGQYSLINVRETFKEDLSKFNALDAQGNEIVFTGDDGQQQTLQIEAALAKLGINAEAAEGGYTIQNPGNIPGLSGGETIRVVVSRDGRLRAVAGDADGNSRLYELNFSGTGLNAREIEAGDVDATTLKSTDPQAIKITKDLIGDRGQTTDILGFSKTLEVSRQAGTGVNAVALSGLRAGGVTDVLNQVSDFQKVETAREDLRLQAAKAAEIQLQQAANLQAASAPNLNQTQVPELGLKVAPLPKLPQLKVAPVKAPKLGGVQPIKQTQPFLGVQPIQQTTPFLGVR